MQRNAANFQPLTPLHFLERAAHVFPARTAVVQDDYRLGYAELFARCRRLASALVGRGIARGQTVSVLAPNIPAMLEAHYGVPMAGAVLNAINTRLDAATIGYILRHGESKLLLVDEELADLARTAIAKAEISLPVVTIGNGDYEAFLGEGDPAFEWLWPEDEWDAIALNYTSGTTGEPKGVVYHHRGAALVAMGNLISWNMSNHPVYLWTLPMFHCNGWCFPWSLSINAGTHVCLRRVDPETMHRAIGRHQVTHLCGAPIIMRFLIEAVEAHGPPAAHRVEVATAASPPPAAILGAMESSGFRVTHLYGLTETYGPAVVNAWQEEWDTLTLEGRAERTSRQGVRYPVLEDLIVANPETLEPVPADGETMGEVLFRGNIVMKGYLKDQAATEKAFSGGWFHSGDLGVLHDDGYIELRDRAKDIIISGGENISTIEVEGVLYQHPSVLEAAVVGRPDEKWGETPCAFVTLKRGASLEAAELIDFCREQMAHFKTPKTVVFCELPKTSTGKVQKYVLRDRARNL